MIQQFHRDIRQKAQSGDQVGPLGKWTLKQVANVDQTPLRFTFTAGSTFADTGNKTVWVRGGASGLDKRQCTAQLTVFADGEPRVKPLLIFKGTVKRISLLERTKYDRRVTVQFQPKAWCDEAVMNVWITVNWKPACSGPMHLIADVHRAQKTDKILDRLENDCNTEVTFIPGGCTSLLQPLDVVVNKPFKAAINRLATQHMQEKLDDYVNGRISAKERRILFTKWVGQAWEEVSSDKEMMKRSFLKTGIAVAIDGSEDVQINVEGLENYDVVSSESSDTDPFSDLEESDMDVNRNTDESDSTELEQ